MTKISYSNVKDTRVNEALDTDVDINTLVAGQVLKWDSTKNKWTNQVGGGGGGAITGTDDAAVFKNGTVGEGDANGITRSVGNAGYTMNLDTTNFRVGINKTNPLATLDVAGNVTLAGIVDVNQGGDTLQLLGSQINTTNAQLDMSIGGIIGTRVYQDAVEAKQLKSEQPAVFDTLLDGVSKVKLATGTQKWPLGTPPFDEQFDYNPLTGFPTGQVVEYQNKLSVESPFIVGRVATGVVLPAGPAAYTISSFGTTLSFQDRMIYDPMQMRSRQVGNSWVYFGAPSHYRLPDVKAILNVKFIVQGEFLGTNPTNNIQVQISQYRNGVLIVDSGVPRVKTIGVCAQSHHTSVNFSGERSLLTYGGVFLEDADWSTDDYLISIVNPAGNSDYRTDFNQVECRWIKAQ